MNSFRPFAGCAVVLVGAIAALSAQARPDFSGRWTSDPEPAATQAPATGQAGARPGGAGATAGGGQRAGGPGAPGGRGGARGDMGSGWGSTITVVQDATRLTVEYTFFSRGDMQPPLRFTYALDGSETTNTVMMGRGLQAQRSRAKWDGDRLVITTIHTFADPATGKPMPATVTQTLTMESPTSLVVETARGGVMGAPATSTKTTYRKL